jgi:hypothetical protein
MNLTTHELTFSQPFFSQQQWNSWRRRILGYLIMFIHLLLSYDLCVDVASYQFTLWDSIFLDSSLRLLLLLLLLLLYDLCVTLASYQLIVDLSY